MASLFSGLFAQQNFIPHGFCLAWEPGLLGLHVISDSIIAIAYYSIPFALLYFISSRRDLAFRGIFALSGAFILACGTTHIMGVVTLWYPAYWLDGIIKLFTAAVSIFTAAAIWWAMPKALALPSRSRTRTAVSSTRSANGSVRRRRCATLSSPPSPTPATSRCWSSLPRSRQRSRRSWACTRRRSTR